MSLETLDKIIDALSLILGMMYFACWAWALYTVYEMVRYFWNRKDRQ